ncbi:MAG: hypothetical protein ACM3ZR_01440 [Pseudomonadota bacterium]
MALKDDIREQLKTFHQVTLVPVNLVEDGQSICLIPESTCYMNSIIKNSDEIEALISISEASYYNKIKAFYHKTDYEECFILLSVSKNRYVIAGPVLTQKLHEGEINNIIRQKKLPIRIKGKLAGYYESLPILDTNKYYYCGKLLELLFGKTAPRDPGAEYERAGISISNEYFSEMIKNREALFHHPPYFLEQ